MPRVVDDVAGRPHLDELTPVEHGDAVGGPGDGTEVVGDEDEGRAGGAELLEDLQDLDAVGGVQGADRLVENDEGRLGDQGAGHGDPLALAAGQLSGQSAEQLLRQVDPVEERAGPLGRLLAWYPLDEQRFGQGVLDGEIRIEAAQRVLEDVLDDAPPAQAAPLAVAEPGDVLATDPDRAGRDAHEAEYGAGQCGLPGARLADDADRLPGRDAQRDPSQGAPAPAPPAVADLQALDGEDGEGLPPPGRRSSSSVTRWS